MHILLSVNLFWGFITVILLLFWWKWTLHLILYADTSFWVLGSLSCCIKRLRDTVAEKLSRGTLLHTWVCAPLRIF